jgi:Uncharacterized protein containing LysM domain
MAKMNPAVILGGLVVGGVALMALAGTAKAKSGSGGGGSSRVPQGGRYPREAPYGADSKFYRLKPGDTLWNMAERFAGSGSRWKELLPLNPNYPRPDPNDPEKGDWGMVVYAGDVIEVPGDWNVPES